MDTERIIINNYDLSSAMPGKPDSVTGFTVVKAKKGPKSPVLIPAGRFEKMQDIFGLSSEKYPELFEAEEFNAGEEGYNVWISAPYRSATIPVAYVTNKGVFPGEHQITIDSKLEKYSMENGICESREEIEKILLPEDIISVLIDTRYPHSGLGAFSEEAAEKLGDKKDVNENPTFSTDGTDAVIINTGMDWTQCGFGQTNSGGKWNTTPQLDRPLGKFRLFIPGFQPMDCNIHIPKKDLENPLNNFKGEIQTVYNGKTFSIGTTALEVTNRVDGVRQELVLKITGSSTPGAPLKTTYVKDTLSSESEHSKIRAAWIYDVYERSSDDYHNIYAVIFPKYSTTEPVRIKFDPFTMLSENLGKSCKTAKDRNFLRFQVCQNNSFKSGSFKNTDQWVSLQVNIDPNGTAPGTTSSNYFRNSEEYKAQDLVSIFTVKPFKDSDMTVVDKDSPVMGINEDGEEVVVHTGVINTGMGTYPEIELAPGVRITSGEGLEDIHNDGWEAAVNSDKFDGVDIFFDSTRHNNSINGLPNPVTYKFFDLASKYPQAGYIFNATISPADIDAKEQSGSADAVLDFGPNYWNICNEASVHYDGNNIISPLTGARSRMQADIITKRFGGVAPMFLNEGELGGQLRMGRASGCKLLHEYNKHHQSILDKWNYNPLVWDSIYKYLLTGHKTCKAGPVTDWSFIGHVCSFLTFQKQVKNEILIQQIGKPNNDYYRQLRKQQVENLLEPRLSGNTRIWAAAKVDTSTAPGVNDAEALRKRQFIINVRVKVDIFSEEVILNFINVSQTQSV